MIKKTILPHQERRNIKVPTLLADRLKAALAAYNRTAQQPLNLWQFTVHVIERGLEHGGEAAYKLHSKGKVGVKWKCGHKQPYSPHNLVVTNDFDNDDDDIDDSELGEPDDRFAYYTMPTQ